MTPEADFINYMCHVGYVYIILLSPNNCGRGVGADGVWGDVSESVKNQLCDIIFIIIKLTDGRTDYTFRAPRDSDQN